MSSYVTQQEAAAYFAQLLHTEAWDDSESAQQVKSLSHATLILERLNYKGVKTDPLQALQFPRYPETVVPTDIKQACCQLALALLDGVDPDLELANINLTRQVFGQAQSTYDTSVAPDHILAGVPSLAAWRLLKPYLHDPNEVTLVRSL